ncbi:MAG: Dihydrolipoyllysine-residue succinyltransferase component of 2-oxoglutarate dehydrogenase complex [Chlamydiales bacterium]|nr:Dihydrolipoyllysine-residue succinyltransferase component of 2-oxoglutarate dehydrogenase complex [Chlamydiales bacterium]MCH9620527.1 Dihydrolipoyllysine-residue succinyltransferase component of 2-oxoglutarate dehydrogenase complex [Chlamydiales bacterium]MCH9623030.1 Dihydrolipoyllysine-residue succinyltransferase component of 2-oxoglutarate dehydrogenase complex [Chlamydiales bacterium]
MKKEIKIPALGESISEASIGSFIKQEGDLVSENDEIVEVETEKVTQALYAPASGQIHWTVSEGDTLPIGTVIGTVDTDVKVEKKEVPPKEELPPPVPPPSTGEGIRKREKEFVKGLKEEPHHPIVEPEIPKKEGSRRQMSKIRQTIARRMVGALHDAAMLTTFNEADMSTIMTLRKKYQEGFVKKHGVKLGFMSFFVKAVADAMKIYPDFNAYIEGEEIVERGSFDIGIAVGTDQGVIVPVLRNVDQLSFAEIEQQIIQYAQAAREKKLSINDLEGGGFTITNGGIYGSLLSTPILNPPQVGILGMHKIMDRPIAEEGESVIRPMMYLALSYDHRMVDGKEAVSFLVHVKKRLEEPIGFLFDE